MRDSLSRCCLPCETSFDFPVVLRRTGDGREVLLPSNRDRNSRNDRIHVSELQERRIWINAEGGNRYCRIPRRDCARVALRSREAIREDPLTARPRSPRDSVRNEYRYTCNLYSSVSSQFLFLSTLQFVFPFFPFPLFLYFFSFSFFFLIRLSKSSSTSLEHHISNTHREE